MLLAPTLVLQEKFCSGSFSPLLPTIWNILCEAFFPTSYVDNPPKHEEVAATESGGLLSHLLQVNRNTVNMVMHLTKYRDRLLKALDVFNTLLKTNVYILKFFFTGISPKRKN